MNIDIEKFLSELNENRPLKKSYSLEKKTKEKEFTEEINKLREEIIGEK